MCVYKNKNKSWKDISIKHTSDKSKSKAPFYGHKFLVFKDISQSMHAQMELWRFHMGIYFLLFLMKNELTKGKHFNMEFVKKNYTK